MGELGAGGAASDAFQRLIARYREGHRRYHTVTHLHRVLADVSALLRESSVADAGAVRLAAFFHDAIYDPRHHDNEDKSAALARRELSALGLEQGRLADVERLVWATAAHRPETTDEQVLCDADLAVLASVPAVYDAYVHGVRAEYAHVSDDEWRNGRRTFVEGFLGRAAIFATAPMRQREPRARANLEAELAQLGTR
jgi:predicted metal-dependent HD superfamily phosphohydrolase